MRSTEPRTVTIGRWPVLVYPDGRIRPIVQGGSGGDPTDPPPDDPQPPTPPAPSDAPPDPLDALQSELNRVGARESAAGRRQAERELLERTGFDSVDAMQTFITEARERQEAELSEAERHRLEAERREQAAERREAEAAAREHAATVRAALVDTEVGSHLEDPKERQARRDMVARLLDVEPGATEEEITAAIDTVRTTAPELFGTPAGDGSDPPPRAPSGFPRGGPRPTPPDSKTRVSELVEGVKERTGIR